VAVDHPAWAAPSVYLGPTAEAPPSRVGGLGAWLDRLSDKPALEVGEREKLTSLLIRQTPPLKLPSLPSPPTPTQQQHKQLTARQPAALASATPPTSSFAPPKASPRKHVVLARLWPRRLQLAVRFADGVARA
jgi:hypothetical protein